MPSASERSRNNVRAGVFVSISLILALVSLIILSDVVSKFGRSTRPYTVSFNVASGVSNLKEGSQVRVGGVAFGEVVGITPIIKDAVFYEIAVKFDLDSRVDLYADAMVLVSAPLIGSESWLDIPSVGTKAKGAPVDGQLHGTASIGVLTNLVGVDNAIAAGDALQDMRASIGDIRTVTGDLRTNRWPTWADSIDRVRAWLENATTKIDGTIDQGHGLLADARTVINENRAPLHATINNAQSATDRINTESIEKLNAFLDEGRIGLDQAITVLENLRVDYAAWATDLGESLANANLTAQQLKLTAIETRRSPWKLLYRPSDKELEHELLYESARSFALAAADLKAASQSVQRVLDQHPAQLADNEEAFNRLKRNLLDSLAKYEKAQQQLLDVLLADQKK